MMGYRGGRIILVAVVVLIALAAPSLSVWYTDWLWFGETGYQAIFLRTLLARAGLGALTALAVFVLLYANFRFALRLLTRPYLVIGGSFADRPPFVVTRRHLSYLSAGLAAIVGLLAGTIASAEWLTVLRYFQATPFGDADPILRRDVAFYVFELPFFDLVRGLFMAVTVLSLIGTLGIYMLIAAVRLDPRGRLATAPQVRTHLSLLVAALLVVLAFGAYLDLPRALLTPSGIITGASYADVEASFPLLRVLFVAALVGAVLAMVTAVTGRLWPVAAALGLYVLVSLGGSGYASAVQRFVVTPNELAKETPYIVHNIAATRKAFALDRIETRALSGDAVLTRADIEANAETIRNVRLWDHQPLLDTFGQIQEIRTYYDFVSVDNDRYDIDGELRQIMLSARELNSESLPNRTWINERLTFTHGYGLTLGPVNEVTEEGLPVLFIKNLPPESAVNIPVTEPSLYFGELSSDHVFVRTRAREFHYPKGDDNVYTSYTGEGGVPVGGFFRKLLFSLRFRSMKILLSDDLTSDSRVLLHRRVAERAATIAPFLLYDADPYMVISNGRLYWILDAYTATGQYPYSTAAANGINYIRNSVKVVVDAFHGRTTFYLADPRDPLAATLGRVFPGFLRPLAEMPEDLRRHLRYPEDIFSLQSAMYATYHMTNPSVYYNREDQWEVPTLETGRNAQPMQPYYTIMRLPGESEGEFIQMLPFTPRRKDNLAAWMVARSDGEHYGRMMVFEFPKQKVVFGPRQIVGRISQDQVISPQITLWNQQGSEVIQGTLLVIPIEESLLYVRPLYLRAAGGRIPELKRVIVAYQNQIVMEETLDEALGRIFDQADERTRRTEAVAAAAETARAGEPEAGGPPAAPGPAGALDALAAEARGHYERALQAQREGNWALYGEEIKRLGEVLQRMGKGR